MGSPLLKAYAVIRSCKTSEQLEVAEKFAHRAVATKYSMRMLFPPLRRINGANEWMWEALIEQYRRIGQVSKAPFPPLKYV